MPRKDGSLVRLLLISIFINKALKNSKLDNKLLFVG